MSEQKDPNEINFDDEFLDIDFDNNSSIASTTSDVGSEVDLNKSPDTVLDIDLNAEPNVGGLTSDNITLSDINLISEATSTPNLSGISADNNMSNDDFFAQLDNLNQTNTNSTTPQTTSSDSVKIPNIDDVTLGAAASGSAIAAQNNNKSAPKKGVNFGGLFGKKTNTPKTPKIKTPKPTKTSKPAGHKTDLTGLLTDPKKLNKLILGGIIVLAFIGVALYMAMSSDSSSIPNTVQPTPANNTSVQPTPSPIPTAPHQEQVVPTNTEELNTGASTDDNILPNVSPVVNPDEILNAEIPNDPALIKEEIDRLADKDAQIAEQEKLIQEQLSLMEDLTTAKAEQIALLEAQIAELEKQQSGNAGSTTEAK